MQFENEMASYCALLEHSHIQSDVIACTVSDNARLEWEIIDMFQ